MPRAALGNYRKIWSHIDGNDTEFSTVSQFPVAVSNHSRR
jgi:hypothetical protein